MKRKYTRKKKGGGISSSERRYARGITSEDASEIEKKLFERDKKKRMFKGREHDRYGIKGDVSKFVPKGISPSIFNDVAGEKDVRDMFIKPYLKALKKSKKINLIKKKSKNKSRTNIDKSVSFPEIPKIYKSKPELEKSSDDSFKSAEEGSDFHEPGEKSSPPISPVKEPIKNEKPSELSLEGSPQIQLPPLDMPGIYGKTYTKKISIFSADLYISISLKPNPDQEISPGLMDIYFILDLSGNFNYLLRRKFNRVKDDIIEVSEKFKKDGIEISYSFENLGYNKICFNNIPVTHTKDKENFILSPDFVMVYELSSMLYKILKGEDLHNYKLDIITKKKGKWKQTKPSTKKNPLRIKDRSCDKENCIQIYIESGDYDKTIILEQSNKPYSDGLCSQETMNITPSAFIKGSKKYNRNKNKKKKPKKTINKNKKNKKTKSSK